MIEATLKAEADELRQTEKRKKALKNHIDHVKRISFEINQTISGEQQAMQDACSSDLGLNAPILVAWLTKHHNDEVVITQALGYLLKHLESDEGCILLSRHEVGKLIIDFNY